MTPVLGPFSIEQAALAVERVRERLLRATAALNAASIFYAVTGDFAVAFWVSRNDESAVRNSVDVDILIRRADFPAAKSALESAGFTYRHAANLDLFLDSPASSPRQAVHLIFANELVRPHEPAPNPDPAESTDTGAFRVLNLEALVRIKLTAFRDKDRTHLRDLIGVGLVDRSWTKNLPPALASRLQSLLDTPDG